MARIWFITGISRGFGHSLATAALDRGDTVVGTTRNGRSTIAHERLHVLALEMTDAAQVASTVAAGHALHGRLDVVVNNAGYGVLGAIEEVDTSDVRHMFDVNVFGPFHVVRAALPFLRAQRSGHVVNISSIAGLAAGAASGMYAATKMALEALSMSLAQEVAPLGIRVTAVEPGMFRTEFLSQDSARWAEREITDYAETSGRMRQNFRNASGAQRGDPARAADAIIAAVEAPEPPLNLVLGPDAMDRARARVGVFSQTLDTWEHISRGTDFES